MQFTNQRAQPQPGHLFFILSIWMLGCWQLCVRPHSACCCSLYFSLKQNYFFSIFFRFLLFNIFFPFFFAWMFIYTQDFFFFFASSFRGSQGGKHKKIGGRRRPKGRRESRRDVQLFCFSRAAVENHIFVIPNGKKKILERDSFSFLSTLAMFITSFRLKF